MSSLLNCTYSIDIAGSPEEVWDFTQDFSKRTSWDTAFSSCELLPAPQRRVFVRSRFVCAVLEYKVFDRPQKTTLQMTDVASYIVEGGGGSWTYEAQGGGNTRWTQSNSLVLRDTLLAKFLRPLVRWSLARNTRRSMRKARRILERMA